jgi:hypothetical protein
VIALSELASHRQKRAYRRRGRWLAMEVSLAEVWPYHRFRFDSHTTTPHLAQQAVRFAAKMLVRRRDTFRTRQGTSAMSAVGLDVGDDGLELLRRQGDHLVRTGRELIVVDLDRCHTSSGGRTATILGMDLNDFVRYAGRPSLTNVDMTVQE